MKVECGQLFWDNKACELPWKVLLLWLHLPAHASTAEDKSFLKVKKRSNFLSHFCAKEKGKDFVSIAVNVFFYNGIIPRMTTTYSHRLRGIGLFFLIDRLSISNPCHSLNFLCPSKICLNKVWGLPLSPFVEDLFSNFWLVRVDVCESAKGPLVLTFRISSLLILQSKTNFCALSLE